MAETAAPAHHRTLSEPPMGEAEGPTTDLCSLRVRGDRTPHSEGRRRSRKRPSQSEESSPHPALRLVH